MGRISFFVFSSLTALTIAACSGGGSTETPDSSPSVSAGSDVEVVEDFTIDLQGSASDDSGRVSVSWTQRSGPPGLFTAPNSSQSQFVVPPVPDDLDIVLRLTADDGVNPPVFDDVTLRVVNVREEIDGPSPQGIPQGNRRQRARDNRNGDRPLFGSFEARTYDGSNNNIANPNWGATFEHLQRLGASDYGNGYDSLAGSTRPSARQISNDVSDQGDASISNTYSGTDFVWQWGQFIDHDLDLTDGANEAADIAVPSGDPFFDPDGTGTQVIPFSRALFDPATGTDASNPREQENEITSWIDGSMVYGSDNERAAAVRDGTSPFLKVSTNNMLPFNEDSLTNANGFIVDPTALFLAGDVRANEQLGLTVMHTLFVREHNRTAERLAAANPNASDDEVFEEARRRVIGHIQAITYREWLPALIGNNALRTDSGYDASVNPTIYNEFSVAAFRLGHSMLNTHLWRLDEQGDEIADGHIALHDAFFSGPSLLLNEDDLDPILRGLATQPHQAIDAKLVSDVRNFLFGQPGSGGFDLASLNIQRGRDHGVPSYNDARVAMGLARLNSFDDISSDQATVEALDLAYASVDDIDLWVGGLAEDPVAGSQLGELFQAILVRQFSDLRDGDRFWYQRDLPGAVVDEIDQTRLSDIIRRNTNIGSELQTNVFETP